MLGKSAKEQKLAELLLEKDTEILSKISSLQESIDAMSKGNKKFLMAATMNEGKYERLEQEILDIKFGAIELLDQFDIILAAIYNSESDELKNGVSSFYKKICSRK